MDESSESYIKMGTWLSKRRPVFATATLILIPAFYWVSCLIVRERAVPNFLGFDVGRAVFRSHFPASFVALALAITALVRGERPRFGVMLLAAIAGAWFALSASFVLHAFPLLP